MTGGRQTQFPIYPYDGTLFDPDPILDEAALKIDDALLCRLLKRLSRDAIHRPIDYSQINPRILGNIYEQFLGYVIEIKEGRLDPQAGRDTRRKQGSFYTPESVTRYLVEQSVATGIGVAAGSEALGTAVPRSGLRQRAFSGGIRQPRGAALRGNRRQPFLSRLETLRHRALRFRRR